MPTSNSTPFDIDYYYYKERGGGPCKKFTKDVIKRWVVRYCQVMHSLTLITHRCNNTALAC
jgi:hypothetical protein